jgi:hypothetical protein
MISRDSLRQKKADLFAFSPEKPGLQAAPPPDGAIIKAVNMI